jgi:hypothetical protein
MDTGAEHHAIKKPAVQDERGGAAIFSAGRRAWTAGLPRFVWRAVAAAGLLRLLALAAAS